MSETPVNLHKRIIGGLAQPPARTNEQIVSAAAASDLPNLLEVARQEAEDKPNTNTQAIQRPHSAIEGVSVGLPVKPQKK